MAHQVIIISNLLKENFGFMPSPCQYIFFPHYCNLNLICFECSAKLVDSALASGKIYDGDGFNYIKESFETGTLHLIGLLSDGGVHSRLDQLQVSIEVFQFYTSSLFQFIIIQYLYNLICKPFPLCSCYSKEQVSVVLKESVSTYSLMGVMFWMVQV